MKETNVGKGIMFFVMSIVVISIGIAAIQQSGNAAQQISSTTSTISTPYSDTVLSNIGIPTTLSQTPTAWTSVTAKNQTWLNFSLATNSYVNITNTASFGLSNITVMGWVKPNNGTANEKILARRNVSSAGYTIFKLTRAYVWLIGNGSGTSQIVSTGNVAVEHNWSSFAGTYNDTTSSLYTNGVLNISAVFYGGLANPPVELTIGKDVGGSWVVGGIDDIQIYNNSKLARAISFLYQENSRGGDKGKRVPIIYYHYVGEGFAESSTVINTTHFTEQMDYLNTSGFKTVNYRDYYNWRNDNFSMPNKPIIITFDDEYYSTLAAAKPIMDVYGFKGVVMIITNATETNPGATGKMSWANMTTLLNAGWDMASHTTNHSRMTNLNIVNRSEQFANSYQDIFGNLSYEPYGFAFPFNDYNTTLLAECVQYYKICNGKGVTSDLDFNFGYKTTNMTDTTGLARIPTGLNLTYFVKWINLDDGLLLDLQFNEGSGLVAHDLSGKSNNGTIGSSVVWVNDGIDKTLLSEDYNNTGNLFNILNSRYAWNPLNASYDYSVTTNVSGDNAAGTMTEFVGVAAALLIIVFLVSYVIDSLKEY